MTTRKSFALSALALTALLWTNVANINAYPYGFRGGCWHGGYRYGGFFPGLGLGLGLGLGAGLGYGYGAYPYYAYPPPVVVASPPIIVGAAPAAPVYQGPPPSGPVPVAPPPSAPPASQSGYAPQTIQSAGPSLQPLPSLNPVPADLEQALQRLHDSSERVRIDAAMQLGRNHVQQAVSSLTRVLSGDSSAQVREAAARSLGLIASPDSLSALQDAAQGDDDRDVRHSAQFAAEIIRTNLRPR